jgi:hypothetical protein
MKKTIALSIVLLLLISCGKKNETPDYNSIIIGKWSCNNYKKDDSDTIVNRNPYSMSSLYENGWEFFANKQIKFKNGIGWQDKPEPNSLYGLMENKTLSLTLSTSIFEYEIIEFSTNKLTIHSKFWKTTYYLLKE